MVNRVFMACLILHNLLRLRYPQHEDIGGEGQRTVVLEGNDIFGVNALRRKLHQLGSPNLQEIFIGKLLWD